MVRRLARFVRSRALLSGALSVVVVGLGVAGWFWIRDSSIASVDEVTVSGLTGPQAGDVRRVLTAAAKEMTTLHVDVGRLRRAVESYPVVKDLEVDAHPLHKLTIRVVERPPVAALATGDRRTAVAADGTLLTGRTSVDGLPVVTVPSLPVGGRLADRRGAEAVQVLGQAPAAMRNHVERVISGSGGLEAQLRRGPVVLLGTGERARAKWIATARVLNDPSSDGASYIDVRLPERPAAGGFSPSTEG